MKNKTLATYKLRRKASYFHAKKSGAIIAGIDEVGRGPIAGPVTVCCVWGKKTILDKILRALKKEGLTDSKKLSKSKRDYFLKCAQNLKKKKLLDYSVVSVSAIQIDKKGISFAIKKAILRATKKMGKPSKNTFVFLDGGLLAPPVFKNQKTIIRGDLAIPIISLASCIAKVTRDAYMQKMHKTYPLYGFDTHVGYGTQKHYKAIKKYGVTSIHRKSWIK